MNTDKDNLLASRDTAHCGDFLRIRQEIGSEFWDVPQNGEISLLLLNGSRWFLSGRHALAYIVSDIAAHAKVRTVAMPSWCCKSMVAPFENAGLRVVYYPVYFERGRLIQEPPQKCDVLYLMNYFGFSDGAADAASAAPFVIWDETHSALSRRGLLTDCAGVVYRYASMRKWAGFWTGGYAWSSQPWKSDTLIARPDGEYVDLRRLAAQEKAAYIEGRSDYRDYLKKFADAESRLDAVVAICAAEDRDVLAAQHLDVERMRESRRANAKVIMDALPTIVGFNKLNDDDCPLFVPILLPSRAERDELRNHLIKNEVFCPVHWPNETTSLTADLTERELSFVCDQRYTVNDMGRVCELVDRWLRQRGLLG